MSSDQSPQSLPTAIENLYRAFRAYRLPPHVNGCPHCVNEADHALLHAAPLPELTSKHLGRYAFKAISTWGGDNEFRHFLPRLFELMVTDDEFPTEPEVLVGKLVYAAWQTWPHAEQEAVRQFFQAWWDATIASFALRQRAITASTAIRSIATAEQDITWYLGRWTAPPITAKRRHLAAFINEYGWSQLPKRLRNKDSRLVESKLQRQFDDWLLSPPVRSCLEEAANAKTQTGGLQDYVEAIAYLDVLRSLEPAPVDES
jgi:hypothetical protein